MPVSMLYQLLFERVSRAGGVIVCAENINPQQLASTLSHHFSIDTHQTLHFCDSDVPLDSLHIHTRAGFVLMITLRDAIITEVDPAKVVVIIKSLASRIDTSLKNVQSLGPLRCIITQIPSDFGPTWSHVTRILGCCSAHSTRTLFMCCESLYRSGTEFKNHTNVALLENTFNVEPAAVCRCEELDCTAEMTTEITDCSK